MTNDEQGERQILGGAVRGIREAKKIPLDRLATDAGINYGFLSRVERGERNASAGTIEALAKALEVPEDYISYVLPKVGAA